MEDKLIVSIESYGIKHTTEASAEVNSDEFASIVFNLMCLTGFHKDNIIESLQNVINENR